MQIPGRTSLNIPLIQEFLMIVSALGLGIAAFIGMCWVLAFGIAFILAHTTSTQMLFMCLIGVGLFHAGRRYLQRAKQI
jgi:hypothetical protein